MHMYMYIYIYPYMFMYRNACTWSPACLPLSRGVVYPRQRGTPVCSV